MSFERLLNKTCQIQTETRTQSGTGSVASVWDNAYLNVPCRFNRAKIGSVVAGALQVTLEDYSFYFLITQAISMGNRIVAEGLEYEVLHVYEDSSSHHKKVIARRRTFE